MGRRKGRRSSRPYQWEGFAKWRHLPWSTVTTAGIVAVALSWPSALPSSRAGAWFTSVILWLLAAYNLVVLSVFLRDWIKDRIRASAAIVRYFDMYISTTLALAGVYMSGWLLDTSPARNQQMVVLSLAGSAYDVYMRN